MITLAEFARLAEAYAEDLAREVSPIRIGDTVHVTDREPVVMATVNLSRDSTYRESVAVSPESAVRKARVAAAQGAHCVDVGAESFLFRRPEAVSLAQEIGLGDRLVHPATYAATIWSRGALRPLPPSVMGVPASADALAATGLLSPGGVERVRAEPGLPPVELPSDPDWDAGVRELVDARLGAELGERLAKSQDRFTDRSREWMEVRRGAGPEAIREALQELMDGKVPPNQGISVNP